MSLKRSLGVLAACLLLVGSMLNPTIAEDTYVNRLTEAEQRGGWKLLFDGKSMDAWRNYQSDSISDGWSVEGDAIVRKGKKAGDLITKEKYDAFELLLEYKISSGGNSGLMFHVTEDNKKPWHSGPEIQIQDNIGGKDGQLAGWLYQLYQPKPPAWVTNKQVVDSTRPAGQWNQIYLRIAPGGSEVCVNGVRYYQFKVGSKDWDKRVAQSKFAKFPTFGKAGNGHICLQDHGNLVSFRNLKVRRLGSNGSVPQPIDSELGLRGELAFPNLKWDEWDPVDDSGNLRQLRLMELTYPDDGSNRLFAVSQQGGIWCFQNDPEVRESHLFLDLRGKVLDWKGRGANEQGLLGFDFHPNFHQNGKFYVYYTHPDDKRSIVSQFTVSPDDPNKADPSSETIVMEIEQPFKNHNGGSIEFGPDGYLYVALGDGGDRNDPKAAGQDLSNLLGSILRIDVNRQENGTKYAIPSENPFASTPGARGEIFAYGVRNPWRIAFDRDTGDLWMGDVGQELWEEVNVITRGGNYGWSDREGVYSFGNRPAVEGVGKPIDPVWQYDHRVGRSITGGRVYRSNRVPELNGKYLYADYVTGTVWALTYDRDRGVATSNDQVFPDSIPVLAFGEDQSGEVFYLTNSARGECIYRFAK